MSLTTIEHETNTEEFEWADVEPVARKFFDIWTSRPELRWAEYAWGLLAHAGLTSYETEVERARCLLRLVALDIVYREFCVRAFDEGFTGGWREQEFTELIGEYPAISLFTLGQMAERFGIDVDDSNEYYRTTIPHEVIEDLTVREYRGVVSALQRQLGDADLFASLWLSVDPGVNYPLSDDEVSEIVNEDLTAEKHMAYEWISEGLPAD